MVFIFIFLLDSSAFPWAPPPSTLQHANKVKSSPHLTPIFQKIKKKVSVLLSTPPDTEVTKVEQGGDRGRMTLARRRRVGR